MEDKTTGLSKNRLSHLVKPGDSLATIASSNWDLLISLKIVSESTAKTKQSIESAAHHLARINDIARPELIHPGLRVFFSRSSQPHPEAELATSRKSQTVTREEWRESALPSGEHNPEENRKNRDGGSSSFRLDYGENLTSAAQTNWKTLQDQGTIPRNWSASNPRHLYLAALRLAHLNGLEDPDHVRPGLIKLSLPSSSALPSTPLASQPDQVSIPNAAQATEILYPAQRPDPSLVPKASEESLISSLTNVPLKKNENGFFSFLLLGKDFDGRPDVIKQILIDPSSLRTAIVDIPRDIRLNAQGNKKLNSLRDNHMDKLTLAVEEITGQSSSYIATISLNDIKSLEPLFTTLFPDGVTLPTGNRYFHSLSGMVFEPHERITDISRLEDYVRMRHAYIVSPQWKPGDSLDGQQKLDASDLERQRRQSELLTSMRSETNYFNMGRAFFDFPLDKVFRKEENPSGINKIYLGGLIGQLKTSGEEPGRFQPAISKNYTRDGGDSEQATAKNSFSSISVDINGLRKNLKDYFSTKS